MTQQTMHSSDPCSHYLCGWVAGPAGGVSSQEGTRQNNAIIFSVDDDDDDDDGNVMVVHCSLSAAMASVFTVCH